MGGTRRAAAATATAAATVAAASDPRSDRRRAIEHDDIAAADALREAYRNCSALTEKDSKYAHCEAGALLLSQLCHTWAREGVRSSPLFPQVLFRCAVAATVPETTRWAMPCAMACFEFALDDPSCNLVRRSGLLEVDFSPFVRDHAFRVCRDSVSLNYQVCHGAPISDAVTFHMATSALCATISDAIAGVTLREKCGRQNEEDNDHPRGCQCHRAFVPAVRSHWTAMHGMINVLQHADRHWHVARSVTTQVLGECLNGVTALVATVLAFFP